MLEIVKKVKHLSMGKALNTIQDVAERVLSKRRWRQYLIDSSKDAKECDGLDGILLNGEYFDWREFTRKKDDMVKAYLRYFTDDELTLIANAM